jgi:hypothetical protein
MENKPLTAREFVLAAAQAYRCPACGAPEVTWSGVDVVGGSAYQAGRCGVCGKVFTAIFRLVGYLRGDDVQTIAEDPGEIGPVAPGDPVADELRRADSLVKFLARLIRSNCDPALFSSLPPLRSKERDAVLRAREAPCPSPRPAAFGGLDYELLDKQVSALYGVMGDLPGKDPHRKLLEGLAELVTQIHEKRPFPAGKE